MSTATLDHHPNGEPVPVPPIDVGPVRRVALIAAAVGLVAYFVLGFVNLGTHGETGGRDFFSAYLVGWVFAASIPFGAMGLMVIAYLTQASWGVVLRRSFQACLRTLPVVALLLVPVVVSFFVAGGKASPYWWADRSWLGDPAAVAAEKHTPVEAVEEAQHKIHDFLNPTFYIVLAVVIFAVLGTFAYFLNKWARPAEENNDERAMYYLHGISGPALIVWGVILTFGLTQWVMSVEPTWASSMFPVVFGMNAFICAMALSVLVFYALTEGQAVALSVVKDKFRIDTGTMLFGFTMLWAYASFCQYMLVWAGDLPEEIMYYLRRGRGGWEYMAYVLMAFHWLLPFVVFLFREVKTSPPAMRAMAVLLLTLCATDVVWWIIPSIPHPEGGLHVPMAFAAILGVGGLWGLEYARQLGKRPILPANRETAFMAAWGHH